MAGRAGGSGKVGRRTGCASGCGSGMFMGAACHAGESCGAVLRSVLYASDCLRGMRKSRCGSIRKPCGSNKSGNGKGRPVGMHRVEAVGHHL
jgi:hypothetical protein